MKGDRMTANDVYKDVRDYLNRQVRELSQEQYLEFLDLLLSDLELREETVREEIERSE